MKRLAFAPLLLTAVACGASAGSPTSLRPAEPSPPATGVATPPPAKPKKSAPAETTPTATKPAAKNPAATKPAASDVDGDGKPDKVSVTERRDSPTTGLWSLTVRLAAGGTVDGVVRAEPQVRPEVLGVADADGDGDGEVFVRVGGGASTNAYTPYTLVEDGMAEVRTADGQALRLLVGGSVTHGDGFACEGRELVVLSVVSDSGTTFEGTRTTYTWNDDRVERTGRTTFTAKQDDPRVKAAYEIDCGDL